MPVAVKRAKHLPKKLFLCVWLIILAEAEATTGCDTTDVFVRQRDDLVRGFRSWHELLEMIDTTGGVNPVLFRSPLGHDLNNL